MKHKYSFEKLTVWQDSKNLSLGLQKCYFLVLKMYRIYGSQIISIHYSPG